MPTPTYTTPPTAPTRGDPSTFSARFAAWLAWMATFVGQLITGTAWMADKADEVADASAAIEAVSLVAIDAAGLRGDSNSTLTVGAAVHNIVLLAAKPNLVELNRRVVLVLKADPSIRMIGSITEVTSTTVFKVTVTSGGVFGTGSFSSWQVLDAAFFTPAATSAEVLQATNDVAPMTPKSLKDALQPYGLVDGPTVTPNGLNGLDFDWIIGGNRTLGAIINTYKGARGEITITQDATGGRVLAWSSVYKRRGGLPVLSTAPGAIDYLSYTVKAVDGSGTATRVKVNFDKAPT